jgi:hypothetical protein
MARFKDFGSGNTDMENIEPLSFKLHGEEFFCIPNIQGKVLLDFIQSASSADVVENARTIQTFFSKVLKTESFLKFDALLDDKEKIVTVEDLSEIVGWLVGEYSDRPEEQPEVLPPGQ